MAVTGCEQYKPCIDADDFGYPKVMLNAQGIDVEGEKEKQVSKWQDSGLVIDGTQVIFDVYGRWFPWLLGDKNIVKETCTYNNVSYTGPGAADDSGLMIDKNSPIPCWLARGMGVYGLTVKTGGSGFTNLPEYKDYSPLKSPASDPNRSISTRNFPANANSFHMGDPDTFGLYYYDNPRFDFDSDPGGGAFKQGVRVGTYTNLGTAGKTQIGDRLYFKILDTYYKDNAGSVVVKIRSGARSPYPGVFEKLINSVSDIMLGSAETIFRRLLDPDRSPIPRAIHALLVLYIALYGLGYIMGMISPNTTQAVFLTKIIKFGVVATLLSGASYSFFYDHLLVLFNEGMKQSINLISGAVSGVAVTDRLTFFDDVFNKLFSEETNIKIASLFWKPNPTDRWYADINEKGLIYIPVLYIFIAFFAFALLKAVLVYLMTLIALGLLIALTPILVPFILFSKTNKIYEGWLKSFIGVTLQPILLFAFLTLMYVILLESLYKTLGYRVCWNTWWSGALFGEGSIIDVVDANSWTNDLKAWMPNIRDKWDAILVPPFFYNDLTVAGCGGGAKTVADSTGDLFLNVDCRLVGEHCRLVDYPSLVPADATKCPSAVAETNADNDALQLMRAQSGTVTSFEDLFFFGVVIFLMYLFSEKIPQLARDIAGMPAGASLETAAGGLWGNVTQMASNPLGIRSLGQAAFSGARRAAGIGSLTKGFKHWQDRVGGAIDQGTARLEKGIKRKALNATGTYKINKGISKFSKGLDNIRNEGARGIHGVQDTIGGKLDKVVKAGDLAVSPMKVADKLAVKGIQKATGKKFGTAWEGVGSIGGQVYGKLAYGSKKKGVEEKSRKMLAGSTGDITMNKAAQKAAQKEMDALTKTKTNPFDKPFDDKYKGELSEEALREAAKQKWGETSTSSSPRQMGSDEREVRINTTGELKGAGMFTQGGPAPVGPVPDTGKADRDKQAKKLQASQDVARLQGRIDALKAKGDQLVGGDKAEMDRLKEELEAAKKDLNS